jgi:tripartite-type tricarboxylate transporter receptor subunit TctC
MLFLKSFRPSWIGLAAALFVAVLADRIARAENIVGDAVPALDGVATEGTFRHLRAFQDIASMSGGNRAAGTPGYDRSAEYVAERLKEAGYLVHFEEFEFPFFEERVPPVLLVSSSEGRQEPAPAAEYIRAGKLRVLAVTTATRSQALPNVPTVGEFVPGYEASFVYGLGAPKNTPTEIVEKLNQETNTGLADPKIKARFGDLGGTVLPGSPADFGKLIADETEKWAKVIRAAGIKAE